MASKTGKRRVRDELTFIDSSPALGRDVAKQQLARTHGIRNAFRKRYQGRQDSLTNFREMHPKHEMGTKPILHKLPRWSSCLAVNNIDPFETLPVNASRLTALLHHDSARQAGEPVFSLNDQDDCRLLYKVFDAGLQDAALANALCLTLKFAANEHTLDEECMEHCTIVIQELSGRLSDPTQAASANNVGAVLLLIVVEGRLGNGAAAQAHLHGVKQIMSLCSEHQKPLSHTIKRAAFWFVIHAPLRCHTLTVSRQDLNTALLAGTRRIFDHETFSELHWHRDLYSNSTFSVPLGFAAHSDKLGHKLLEILGDISALQQRSQSDLWHSADMVELLCLDNHQAWVESRLQHLLQREDDKLIRCCIYAAYLCAYSMFTRTWSATTIPCRLSFMLARELEAVQNSCASYESPDLVWWTMSVGICFTRSQSSKARYARIWVWHSDRLSGPCEQHLEHNLNDFIWLRELFETPYRRFLQSLDTMTLADLENKNTHLNGDST